MTKKSRKRPARFEKHQAGCMWSLINIFDFRHGRPSQKLLSDRKHGGKRIVGAGYPDIMLDTLGDSCEVCKETNTVVQSETSTTDASKMSVKELMEEEMFGDQDQRKCASIVNSDTKQSATGDEGHVKKNHGWIRSKIDLDADDFVAAADLVADKPSRQKNKPSGSVDLNVKVEELCTRIHEKDVSDFKPGNDGQLATQHAEDPFIIEEKLCEATKVLVNHFTDEKSFNKDRRIQSSQELVDALHILNSNKEAFLKLLKDPNSILTKNIQTLQDIQVEEGKFKVLTDSDLLEHNSGNAKQQNFFWRRFKGLERNSTKKNETSEDLNRIVVLKPGPLGSRNLGMAGKCGSLPESPRSVGDKVQIERASSPFSFAEFKRKLKHVMRIEHYGFIHNGLSRHAPKETQMISRDKKTGEAVAMASPSRDHFFIERIPKLSPAIKQVKGGKSCQEHVPGLPSAQRMSNIYVEAKKHLAEIVGNGDVDVDSHSKQVPKPLGRILSFSGYSSPAICSPRTDGGVRLSLDGQRQTVDDIMKQTNPSLLGCVKQESENGPCIAAEKPFHEPEVPVRGPHFLEEPPCESEPPYEAKISALEADADIVRSSDADSCEESNPIEISFKSCCQQPSNMGEVAETSSKFSKESHLSVSLGKETGDENELSSSPFASALTCSVSEKIGDPDMTSDATSKPSPVSVLEPLFKEDDISPPGIKSFTVVESFQPRQIHFEAEFSSPAEQILYNRYTTEDSKYTFEFVKAVVQMSGLTWGELLERSLFSDHLIDPELIDEVDFLPDLLPCDFNLLFYLINEILIEICWVNFGCTLSFAKPFVHPVSKGKDIFTETWKEVDWYLKMDWGPPHTLDQVLANDFAKARMWMDLQLDNESIGLQLQESILEELVEELVQQTEYPLSPLAEAEGSESQVSIEL